MPVRNTYKMHVRQFDISPADCNRLYPHWDETFTNAKVLRARARQVAAYIRKARNNYCKCYVAVYKNDKYYGEYVIVR